MKALARQIILFAFLLAAASGHAIPPNTPIANTATASFTSAGVPGSASDSVVIVTDGASGNSPPSGMNLAPSSVNENAPGASIGAITVADLDPTDTHTITVSDPRFEVVAGNLRLASGVSLDFEAEPSVTLQFTITDSAGATITVTRVVTVMDVNEPPTAIALDDSTFDADRPGAVVGNLTVTDPDAGDTHTFVVDDPRFEVVGGQLKLIDSVSLPLGTAVTVIVTATDSGGLDYSEAFTVTAVPPGSGAGSDAQIRFFAHAPASVSASNRDVGATQCATGAATGPFSAVPPPLANDGSAMPVPGSVPLVVRSVFGTGTGFFVEVIDPDANLDNTLIDTVGLDLTTASGDAERIVLTETTASSGVFLGYFSTAASGSAFDCALTGGRGETITARYIDPTDPTDTALARAFTDPVSRVFLSSNGMPLDGVQITLLDAAGAPATVRGDDGIAVFPSSVVSGATVADSAGTNYAFAAGEYYFPIVGDGDYRVAVTVGNRFGFPSSASDAALQALPSAPFVLSSGSRGALFNVPVGPVFVVDLPVDLLPIQPTSSSLTLLAYAPGNAAATTIDVAATQCFDGAGFIAAPAPTSRGAVVPVPGPVALVPASVFGVGEPVFVQLTDPDQDADPFAPDTVIVDVRASGGDVERVRLTETGASTGVFVGWIDQATGGGANDCALDADAGATVDFDYLDATNASDRAIARAQISPASRVFGSSDGAVIDGASVTLIDTSSGLPATVYADDGVTTFPATVISGADAVDGNGVRIDFAPGTFRFPVVPPGTYRFDVTPPPGYQFPSAVADAALNALPGAPFVLGAASRGTAFTLGSGETVGFDLPLDVIANDAFLTKVASKDVAAIGDFVQYQVRLTVPAAATPLTGVTVLDQLPRGFRYVDGSARVDGIALTDPLVGDDGRSLTFSLPTLAPGATAEVRYVTEIGAGARLGRAENTVRATGTGIAGSNVASAVVTVREELFGSRSILVGEVMAGACGEKGSGVAGVRMLLEDGTFVVTDEDGKYHIEGLKPGTHVIQVDLPSIPATHELVDCAPNSRGAGRTFSRFIDLAPGTLWREDFRLVKKPPMVGAVHSRMLVEATAELARVGIEVKGGLVAIENVNLTVLTPSGVRYRPGSARLNGSVIAEPTGIDDGALTFRVGSVDVDAVAQVEFLADVDAGVGDFSFKSLTQFEAGGNVSRTPVAIAEVKGAAREASHESRFAEADAVLSDADRAALATMLLARPNASVDVVGHADSLPLSKAARTRFADNYALSKARAEAVAAAMTTQAGVAPPPRMQVRGVGSDQPVADNATAEGRALNRRAAVLVVDEAPASRIADSGPTVVEVTAEHRLAVRRPIQIPELPGVATPQFDGLWLAAQDSEPAMVWPPEGHVPRIPAVGVVVKHPAQQRMTLTVNGRPVNVLSFEGTETDARGVSVSRYRSVPLVEGTNRIEATLSTGGDSTTQVLSRVIHFSGSPVRAQWVAERSHLVADGVTPPVLAVRLLDREGKPVRPGVVGTLTVADPYRLLASKPLGQQMGGVGAPQNQYLVREDGIAYVELEPTPTAGRLRVSFAFGELRQQEIRARIAPATRDWVLVGFGEGTVGYGKLSGSVEPFADDDVEEDVSVEGRTAFYAKGRVRGDMLLTLAYDSDNERDNTLGQQIDPNRFYTLYGDGTEQNYDAASQRKLYVRLERDDFFALFGDFETGFDEAELTRYARTLNGAQGAYYGDRVRLEGFAAETDQGLYRDQIRGDGTSGIYRLSRGGLVVNSESLRIEVRDRFKTEVVLDSRPLTRYLDYSIDFDRGTFFMKRPVPSQDNAFNPVFIVAEYEIAGSGDSAVAGMRAAVTVGPADSEAAVSVVHDDSGAAGGDLLGVDLRYRLTEATELRVEGAVSDTDVAGRGTGYLAELEHQSDAVAGRVYAREQEAAFGLGQQAVTEAGTRKIGLEGEYAVTETMRVRADAFQQTQVDGDGERRVAETRLEHNQGQRMLFGGLRAVQEDSVDGRRLDGNQLVMGGSQGVGDGRLTLHSTAEIELGGDEQNTDYPNRLLAGAEYRVLDGLSVIGEQELTFGDRRDTQDTRVGIAAAPWSGADVATSIEREHGEQGERLFATTGLLQQWQVNERWQLDFGMDRVQTLRSDLSADVPETLTFNPAAPPASGAVNSDFSAYYAGGNYRRELWDASGRLEFHQGDVADKWNLLAGVSRQLAEGRVVAASFALNTEQLADGAERNRGDVRVGLAWRPSESPWSVLNRVDLTFDELIGGGFDTRTRKLIENFNLNYAPDGRHQLALQLGLKYALEDIDGDDYDGATSLSGLEYRFDLSRKWDVGVRGAALHSFASNATRYSTGVSMGHSPVTNIWVSVGYNFIGFEDRDFTGADYTAQGPYLKLRFKVDQSSIREYLEYASFSEAPRRR